MSKPVYDSASGVVLDPQLALAAWADELEWDRKLGLWITALRSAVPPGKKAAGTKRVHHNNGDEVAPNDRSRLVAKGLRAFAPWVP